MQRTPFSLADAAWRDGRYALRSFRKSPAFAAAVILTLALGIGATTALFTVLYGVILKPLPYREPGRLVYIATGTVARYDEMKPAAQSYTDLSSYITQPVNVTLSGEGEPEVLRLANVSANFLNLLGVEPLLGRSFVPAEENAGSAAVAVISAELWRRKFAGDAAVIGKNITLAGGPCTIIGVLPDGFQFPFTRLDLWMAKPMHGFTPASPVVGIFGRLRPGVGIEQASSELAVLTQRYAAAHPGMLDAKPNTVPRVSLLQDLLVDNVRSLLWILFGAVGLVLLIACANVANLLLARSHARRREFAVRAAIGAGRRRIIRQLLVEGILLALAGGIVGVFLGTLSLNAITRMTAFNLPRISDIQLDGAVLWFAAGISIATGVLFGVLPSVGVSTLNLSAALKSGTSGAGTRRSRTRTILVIAQVALSVVLLIGATLLMQTMLRLYRADLLFNPNNVLTVQMSPSAVRYDTLPKKITFIEEFLRRIASLPGVQNAGVAWTLPFMSWPGTPVEIAEHGSTLLNERRIAVVNNVDAGYFQSLQIPLQEGRLFSDRDDTASTPVAIINEALARHFWPDYPNGSDPVGRRILIGVNPTPFQVVGVVGNISLGPGTELQPGVYRPYRQAVPPSLAFSIRTTGDPMRFAGLIRNELRAIDPDQAIIRLKTLNDLLDDSLGPRWLVLRLLELFAGTALVLAMVGVYGVMTHTVTQRTREVGIRLALGARGKNIVIALAGQAVLVSVAGIAIGIAGAFVLSRFLKSYLFGVSPTEVTAFIGVALAFLIVASASAYIPLRRATRVDPMKALRQD